MAESEKIDRYELKSRLGKGGMATVYLAHDPHFDRQVAVKVLPREFLHDEKFLERFDREAKSIAKLEHSTIVPVYDYGAYDGQPFIVMRHMAGGSLKDRMAQGTFSTPEILNIILRIADALQEAHLQGIIHRDLKPGNILFDARGNAYLADFGIAKLSEATAELTGSALIGTPAYMSPEQVQGDEKIDGRSDVYSLGIILYEMLAGKKPYEAETPAKLVFKHLLDPIPNILEDRADLPGGLKTITDKALAKDRDERYGTSIELSASLKLVLEDELIGDAPEPESLPVSESPAIDQLSREALDKVALDTEVQPKKKRVGFNWRWVASGAVVLILLVLAFLLGRGGMAIAISSTKTPTPVPPLPDRIVDDYGHEMALVLAGDFTMGSEDGDSDEKPARTVYLDTYYIDLYEVTNRDFAKCVDAGVCSKPGGSDYSDSEYANHPVVYVAWLKAQTYCEWRGGSLPTEAEWEKAARGDDGRTYPWGERINSNYANYKWSFSDTMPVGSYPDGISPYGLYDVAGNVWEWVADWYDSDTYAHLSNENPAGPINGTHRVMRGGGWNNDGYDLRSANRSDRGASNSNHLIGFRCASSP